MKRLSALFSMLMTLALLTSLMFQVTPASAKPLLAGAGEANTVLIYGPGTAKTVWHDQAVVAGFTVEVADDTAWNAKTTADFATYKAIIIPDNGCLGPSATVLANRATWGAAVTGNLLIIGGDPDFHAPYVSGATQLIYNGIKFAGDDSTGKTGALIPLGCSPDVTILDPFGTFAGRGLSSDDIHMVASHPSLTGLTDALLSNWDSSTHTAFTSFPAEFIPLAIQNGATGVGALTFPDGSSGTPYLLARGEGLTPIGDTVYNLTVSGTYNYLSSSPAITIATGLTASSDPAGSTIDGAIVIISANFQAGDTLSVTDSGNVYSSYNTVSGVLTLLGTDDVSVYQTVLGTVKFSTNSINTSARAVTYSLGTALPYGPTGHFFEYVPSSLIDWNAANVAASARTYFGRTGYLATLNDAGENTFAATKIGGAGAWVGGTDTLNEGAWKWATGPEGLLDVGGAVFCSTLAPGSCPGINGWYQNWNTGEPNNNHEGLGIAENYLQFLAGSTGVWNDLPGVADSTVVGYVVEYGGMDGDTPMTIQGEVTVNVTDNTAPVAAADAYSTDVATLLDASTVLVNDIDAESDSLTSIKVTDPAHASAFTFNANGTFTYTPSAGFSGQDTFTYKANDGIVDSNTVTVTIDVVPTLTIVASGPATVKPGDQYVYTFDYTVNAATLNTQVDFTLPGHTTFVSSSLSSSALLAGIQSTGCGEAAGVVTCNLGTVSTNGSFTVTVLVDKLKKVNTPLTLDTAFYSINSTSAVPTNGSAAVTADTLTPFADVPAGHAVIDYIQSIWAYGITGGCVGSPLSYCPNVNISRAEMAIYIERGIHTGAFNPGTPALTFTDTSTNSAKYWIETLKADGITGGCTPTTYCPTSSITRSQMSIFLLRGKYWPAVHVPPAATGLIFTDVPANSFAASWIEELKALGITSGCGPNIFCPNNLVTRSDMALFMQRTFNLPMPTP